ncbi:unnamed protein product [Plasmodium vivax]|uniref:(malaria parasite P. vivax) hypothetical protein n=1 Tax=Plasmodium vivax TaxID=5855 RepID=A0A8S4HIK8_PLAVI|nr:unnamed protein product [Plasmodium vivax]
MEESIYKSVKKFPDLKSVILSKNVVNTSANKSSCENYITRNLKDYNDDDHLFLNTCAKIADNKTEILKEAESSEPIFCKYMNYMFYDMLKSMKSFQYYRLLNQFYTEIEKFRDCLQYKEYIDQKTYEELKILSELYDDFIDFKKESSVKNEKPCTHGTKCVDHYRAHAKNCKNNYNNNFCMILIDFREEYEDYKTIFTPLGAWLRPRLPGGKKKANILDHKMSELPKNSKTEATSYKVSYHSS